MGGGGMLRIPNSYKDKLWASLSPQLKRVIISYQHRAFERNLYKNSVEAPRRLVEYHQNICVPLAPDYDARNPVIDYKRQSARGTWLPGVDSYFGSVPPGERPRNRLENFMEPYTPEEDANRAHYRHFNVKLGFVLLFGALLVHDYRQSRPIVWCVNFPPAPPQLPWHFVHLTNSHDVKSVRRGFEVFRQVCSSCHSIKTCRWWYLMKDVYPVRRVEELAAERTIVDGVTHEGEINARPCMTWDYFPPPFPTEEAAKEANNGKVPPDFSDGPNWRRGGVNYFFSILTGFRDPPIGLKLTEGTAYNPWFDGGIIGMMPPLEDGLVEYEDGTPATVSQMAKDVCNFLVFVADPQHDEKKLILLKFLGGMLVSLPFFWVMRRFALGGVLNRRFDFEKIRQL